MKRIGFTLSETLIVLGIIAVIATLSVLAINNAKPDESIVMFRHAYVKTQQLVKELITDESLYPNAKELAMNDKKLDNLLAQNSEIIKMIDKMDKVNSAMMANDDLFPHFTTTLNNQPVSRMCYDEYVGATSCVNSATFHSLIDPITFTGPSSLTLSNKLSFSAGFSDNLSFSVDFSGVSRDLTDQFITSAGSTTSEAPKGGSTVPSNYSAKDFETYQIAIVGKGFSDTAIPNPKPAFLSSATASNKFANCFLNRANAVKQSISGNHATMQTADGMYWDIYDRFNESDSHAIIEVYTDGYANIGNSCAYDASTCKNPNKFAFRVEKSGQITTVKVDSSHKKSGNDPMACSYLRYPRINKTKQISTDSNVNTCFAN